MMTLILVSLVGGVLELLGVGMGRVDVRFVRAKRGTGGHRSSVSTGSRG